MSIRQVQTTIRELEETGFIETEIGGGRQTNRYTIMPTPPHILHPTPAHCAGVTPAHPAPHPRTVCGAPPQNRTPPNIRNHQKTVTEPNGVCAITEFELFWSAYPKKEGRLEAERAFVEVMGKDKTADILAGIAAQKKAEAWMKDQGRYIPAPARWLREGRWMDGPVKKPESFEQWKSACGLTFRRGQPPRREQFNRPEWPSEETQERMFEVTAKGFADWLKRTGNGA